VSDIGLVTHLDLEAAGSAQDPLAGTLLGGLALELGLFESRDGIADVSSIVDREMLLALAIDIGKLVRAQAFSLLGRESRHDVLRP
jgi:hypothetical protein